MEKDDMMTELVKNSRKQLFYQRLRTGITAVVALAVILCMLVVVPVVLQTAAQANEIMAQASETIVLADTAIESITEMSKNMDTFITDNGEAVAAVMEEIEAVDFEGLNEAIGDLKAVIKPLADFFNKF